MCKQRPCIMVLDSLRKYREHYGRRPMADSKVGAGEEITEQRVVGFEEDLSDVELPQELPILPLRGVVIFPSAIVPLLISRASSLKLVEDCRKSNNLLGLAAQKNPEDEAPGPQALFSRGSAGRILKMLKYPDDSVRILVPGAEADRYSRIRTNRALLSRAGHAAGERNGSIPRSGRAASPSRQPICQIRLYGSLPAG